jgi:tellurite resistance protein TerC
VIAGTPTWIWVSFIGAILALLVFDLTVLQRRHPEPTLKLAAKWTAFWVGLGMAFGVLIWQFWPNIAPGSPIAGSEAALLYLTGYIVEESLSIDNIFVFLIIFSYFNVPDSARHKVLFLGILGAIIFRAIFIFAGSALLHQFAWLELVFGALLIFQRSQAAEVSQRPARPGKQPSLEVPQQALSHDERLRGTKALSQAPGPALCHAALPLPHLH